MTLAAPRYVVLHHHWPDGPARFPHVAHGNHYDWMFQITAGLLTWATAGLPATDLPSRQPAVQLPPHRRAYLQYQGPVSGGRGNVVRVEQGEYRQLGESPERHELMLFGPRHGRLVFHRDYSVKAGTNCWSMEFLPADEPRRDRFDAS